VRLGRAGERALARGDLPAAVNLLERSLALVPAAPSASLLHSLGVARVEAGDLEAAEQALSSAIGRADEEGDVGLATLATVERLGLRQLTGRATEDEVRSEAEHAVSVLERLGDEAGLAKAWLQLASNASSMGGSEQAAGQAYVHACRAGQARDEEDALFQRLSAALYGERSISDVTELCERLLAEAHGPMAEVGTLEILGALKVRSGELAEGRELYRQADRLYQELGMKLRAAINWQCWGRSELAAGDFSMAEAAFRNGIDISEAMGEQALLGWVLAHLAHALCAQGRHAEAEPVLDRAEDLLQDDGFLAPSARARVLAARGELEAALALGRKALATVAEEDWPEARAQVLVSLAEVQRRADRPSEEASSLREALDLYEHKGIRPAVERVRARLEKLEALPTP
jgi:tetratricopeptide (TPR) repeat protein